MNLKNAFFTAIVILSSLGASASGTVIDCDANKNKELLRVKQGETLFYKQTDFASTANISVRLEKRTKNGPKAIRNGVVFEKDGALYVLVPFQVNDAPGKYVLKGREINSRKCLFEKQVVLAKNNFSVHRSKSWRKAKVSEKTQEKINAEKSAIRASYLMDGASGSWLNGFGLPIERNGTIGMVTHPFGEIRKGRGKNSKYVGIHFGVDFRAPQGYPVRSIGDGVVVLVGERYVAEGNLTIISHGNDVFSLYLHQSSVDVKEGEKVLAGQVIGKAGETGAAFGAHLDLRIRVNGVFIDPMQFIQTLRKTNPD